MEKQSDLVKSQEKSQIKWVIRLVATFVVYAARHGALSPSQARTLGDELGELAQVAEGEDTPETLAEQLNHYITLLNAHTKSPFPGFFMASHNHLRSSVLNQIEMVQRAMTEAGEAGLIDWEKQSDVFVNVLKVFRLVESQKMAPEEGIARLSSEIKRINSHLPAECPLPVPDINGY